jgi:type VI secretion system protein
MGPVACGDKPAVEVDSVDLVSVPKANDNSPVAVDLVYVRERLLVDEILKLSAADWFQRKVQYLRDHPKGLTVFDWELVPDQSVSQDLTDDDAWAVIAFANYGVPGVHRIQLPSSSRVRITLGTDDILIQN